jgi:hypothetical protein
MPPGQMPPQRRVGWIVALGAGGVVVAVLIVAIVVVTAMRKGDDGGAPVVTASGAGSPTGPIDKCLVGTWKQTEYQNNIEFSDLEVGKRENLGKIKMSGGGKKWTINADGSAEEDDSETRYRGRAADGRAIEAVFSGSSRWTLKTADGKIIFAGVDGNTSVVINVDGRAAGRIDLKPNNDPVPYTCTGDSWRTTSSKGDDSVFTTYERVR